MNTLELKEVFIVGDYVGYELQKPKRRRKLCIVIHEQSIDANLFRSVVAAKRWVDSIKERNS